ncbi:MAG: hypothetical protein ACI9VS_000426 [Candidatus Binatia bacterium]|jgi:hypothetical protein
MALILKDGTVFLHLPKTGGNWVTKVLRECGLAKGGLGHKHANMDRLLAPMNYRKSSLRAHFKIHRIKKALTPKPFIFCFVRHPLAWYESWFNYMTQLKRNWRSWGDENDLFDWHPNADLNGCGASNFNQFMRNVIDKRPGYVTELFASYAKSPCDFVGKQESLREDLVKVLKRLSLKFDEDFIMNFQPFGVSPKLQEEIVWEPGLKEETLALEHIALLRYGYPLESDET